MFETPSSLPEHGRVTCSRCFPGATVWNETELRLDGWHVVNNPMSWGTATPRFLLLGVSKGTTQCDGIAAKPHDEVPFDGFRPMLTKALQLLGLLRPEEIIDNKITSKEQDWAFGSMVRCSLGLPKANDLIERSGNVIQRLAAMPVDSSWITRCSSAFLRVLPESVRVVVLLSNDDRYTDACFAAVRRLRPATTRINAVAYGDKQITWVHIIHVGGPGRNHIKAWFQGQGVQGEKRCDAQWAVRRALGGALHQDAPLSPVVPVRSSSPKLERKAPSGSKGEGKPTPSNTLRDTILHSVRTNTFFVSHPAETKADGTKYVSAFRGKNGGVIAFDKTAASKQPMWLLDELPLRKLLQSLAVPFDVYPPEKGRNSNLKKLSEFKDKTLLRAFPETEHEAMAIVNCIVRL